MKKYHSLCPIETTLNLIGNKWKILIIRDLLQGTKRFGELRKSISFTKKSKHLSKCPYTKFTRIRRSKTDQTQSLCRSSSKG